MRARTTHPCYPEEEIHRTYSGTLLAEDYLWRAALERMCNINSEYESPEMHGTAVLAV